MAANNMDLEARGVGQPGNRRIVVAHRRCHVGLEVRAVVIAVRVSEVGGETAAHGLALSQNNRRHALPNKDVSRPKASIANRIDHSV